MVEAISLNVDKNNNLIDFEVVLDVTFTFGIGEKQAKIYLDEIKSIVENNWRILVKKYGLVRGEIERMSPAFDMEFKG